MRIKTQTTVLALTASACVLAMTFILPPPAESTGVVDSNRVPQTNTGAVKLAIALDNGPEQGHRLFDHNCAHCHGDDARGDEGPSLHNLTLSDARIAKRIKEGIKGEMPKFGSKFTDADIEALIAYLRTLKD